VVLAACSHPLELRGSPPGEPEPLHVRDSALVVPPPGETRAAALDDGFPVWLVRHADGTLSVISGVAPRERSGATLFAAGGALVRWLPASRRLLAGDVAYDETGHVLGVASDDDCFDACPRIAEPADGAHDLDAFAFTAGSDGAIAIGAPLPAGTAPTVSTWVEWDHEPHQARDLPPQRGEVAPDGNAAIDDARAWPIGSYAVVAGSIVQSTSEPPRLCGPCGACTTEAPHVLGVPTVTVSAPIEHAESGTILVRRERAGLAVIATAPSAACL